MSGHVHEPHIVCPKCSHQIALTELIAAPLLEAQRRGFRRSSLHGKPSSPARPTSSGNSRMNLPAREAKKARDQVADDLNAMKQRLLESEQLLEARNAKLAEAQQAQAEALRKQRELDEKSRELEIIIEKRVQASQAEQLKSQVSQKDAQIDSLRAHRCGIETQARRLATDAGRSL